MDLPSNLIFKFLKFLLSDTFFFGEKQFEKPFDDEVEPEVVQYSEKGVEAESRKTQNLGKRGSASAKLSRAKAG